MFKINKIILNRGIIKYQFNWEGNSNRKVTYAEFIDLLKSKDKDFLQTFKEALDDGNKELKAYFWECPPVLKATKNVRPFEFVLTKSETLRSIKQSYSSFNEHFIGNLNDTVVSFPNLGRDATLVVPVPQKSGDDIPTDYNLNWQKDTKELDYKSISSFTKNAPLEDQKEFWQKVANDLERDLNNDESSPKWLSTHGLGVYYLHVRIDSRPRYYSCEEYKRERVESFLEENNQWAGRNIDSSQHGISSRSENIWKQNNEKEKNEETSGQVDTNTDKKDNDNPNYQPQAQQIPQKINFQQQPNSVIVQDVKENPKNWKIVEVVTECDHSGLEIKKEVVLAHNSVQVDHNGKVDSLNSQPVYRSQRFNQQEINEINRSLSHRHQVLLGNGSFEINNNRNRFSTTPLIISVLGFGLLLIGLVVYKTKKSKFENKLL